MGPHGQQPLRLGGVFQLGSDRQHAGRRPARPHRRLGAFQDDDTASGLHQPPADA